MTNIPSWFSILAGFYCFIIGLFALTQGIRRKTNLLFAAYCFSNAFWNIGDMVLLLNRPMDWLPFIKITGIGGCLLAPFVVHFSFEIANLSTRKNYRQILIWLYSAGVVFSFLNLTPLLQAASISQASRPGLPPQWSDRGVLYPFFSGYMLISMSVMATAMLLAFLKSRGLQRKQLTYILLACGTGTVALISFFISGPDHDYFVIYYPGQALVTFIFGYAIFQHNLIPVRVAFKRVLLVVGLYFIAALLLASVFIGHNSRFSISSIEPTWWLILAGTAFISSLVPTIYGFVIRKSSFFKGVETAQIIHEFKTPIHAILSARAILEDELSNQTPDAKKISEYLALTERNAARLESFVIDLLKAIKTDEITVQESQKVNLDLEKTCQEAIRQFPSAQIHLDSPPHVQLHADPEGVMHILTNLFSNALKFSNEKPIHVRIVPKSNYVEVAVQDQGVGLRDKDLGLLFKPFSQVFKNKKAGSGLGLFIAKTWVEAHGGKIWAESEGEGKGTTMKFTLPI